MIFPSPLSLAAGLIFGVGIAASAYRLRALSFSGAIAAAGLGWVVFGLGGWSATAVLLTFFLSSSGLSIAFGKQKRGLSEKHSKGNRRDAMQVLANGGIAGLCLILLTLLPQQTWLWPAYCAGFAAANADTWASELGVLSRARPRLITNGKEVEMGTSGAITWLGSAAAISGALTVALVGVWVSALQPISILWISLAGFAGCLIDSYLGATIQAVYFCPACQKETERHPLHSCGTQTMLQRGLPWLNNDVVNGFCTLSAPVLIGLLTVISLLR
jgi:uncharacterized protein (TIGR00297 family)